MTNQPFLYIITFRFLKNVLLAQSVEHFTFNEGVAGSNPAQDTIFIQFKSSLNFRSLSSVGRAPPLQGGCHKFESYSDHHLGAAVVQMVRMPPCHGGGRGFEPRPLRHFLILLLNFYFHSANISKIASLAQLVEHITLNDGVVGSNPTRGIRTHAKFPYIFAKK